MDIVEGKHPLWNGVTEPYKHTIRAFLIFFQNEILRNCHTHFDYRNGSVGNFFFAGARLFFHSLEAAIFLFSRVARIPEGSKVLPAIQTEERITLGAQLENGDIIRGQSQISHPREEGIHIVDKRFNSFPLPAAIRRIFYLAREGNGIEHEVAFEANGCVLSALEEVDMIIYGMGSLYTSICPSLILKGIGEVVAKKRCPKGVILNGNHDRETYLSPSFAETRSMKASDVIKAIANALNRRECTKNALDHPIGAYVTFLIAPIHGRIEIDRDELKRVGMEEIVQVDSVMDHKGDVRYKPDALVQALQRMSEQNNSETYKNNSCIHSDR